MHSKKADIWTLAAGTGLWKVLVVLGVVFAVGCGAATAQDSLSPIAPILAGEAVGPTLTADERLDAYVQAADDTLDAAVQGEAVGPTLTADAYFQDKLDAAYAASAAAQREAVGPTLTADERLDAYVQAADDRLDAAVQGEAVGLTLTADERLDAAFREVEQEALNQQELPAGATLEAIPLPSLLQEGDAIKLVQFELRKSLNNCASLGPYRCSEDQVLKAFGGAKKAMPSFRVNLISAIGKTLLEQGEWTAVYESDSRRWRVEVESSAFHVYETTLIVEGVAP